MGIRLVHCALEPPARSRIIRVDPRAVKDGFDESAFAGVGIGSRYAKSLGLASFIQIFS